jgi:hypothetical protein
MRRRSKVPIATHKLRLTTQVGIPTIRRESICADGEALPSAPIGRGRQILRIISIFAARAADSYTKTAFKA